MSTYTAEMIKVMQAFQEGKEIETRIRAVPHYTDPQPWFSANTPAWDWAHQEYRVKQTARMTYRELAEWLAKGKGQWKFKDGSSTHITYPQELDDGEVPSTYTIRHWNSDGWVTPTKDIFEEDCR